MQKIFCITLLRSPSDLKVCFIKYDAPVVPHFGPFIKIIINALRASLFSVLLLLILIHLIALPTRTGHTLVTVIIYENLAIEVIIKCSIIVVGPTNLFQEPFGRINIGL